jgi:hypothetical protein
VYKVLPEQLVFKELQVLLELKVFKVRLVLEDLQEQ